MWNAIMLIFFINCSEYTPNVSIMNMPTCVMQLRSHNLFHEMHILCIENQILPCWTTSYTYPPTSPSIRDVSSVGIWNILYSARLHDMSWNTPGIEEVDYEPYLNFRTLIRWFQECRKCTKGFTKSVHNVKAAIAREEKLL